MAKSSGRVDRVWAACGRAWVRMFGAVEGSESRARGARRIPQGHAAEVAKLRRQLTESARPACTEHARSVARQRLSLLGITLVLGCHSLEPSAQRALDVFSCQCKALEPYVGAAALAEDIVRRVSLGSLDLHEALAGFGLATDVVESACAAVDACTDESPVAPPPAYGNKLL